MTPLETEIRRLIEIDGPMPIDRYMALCLSHPQHGYYIGRDPLGAEGDFTTAPEISQIFGELVGVWCAQAWQAMGGPDAVKLIELGPGRGTLMADVMRAARALPEFANAVEIHLVETSPALRQRQAATLDHLDNLVHWHETINDVPPGPGIVVANEFFDALAVRQLEYREGVWRERVVGIDDDQALCIGLAPDVISDAAAATPDGAGEGDVWETSRARARAARHIAERSSEAPTVGLIIDYGHVQSGYGDTLQAVRDHAYCPATDMPGECDLTSHVDFEALAVALSEAGCVVHQALEQSAFLGLLGIEVRADALKRTASSNVRGEIDAAVKRLTHCDEMGRLFKVCAFSSPAVPPLYPFGPETT